MVIDADEKLFPLSIYNIEKKVEEKLTMKVSQIIAFNPEVHLVRNLKQLSEAIKNVIAHKPKQLLIDGVDLKAYLAQEKIEMKLIDG